MFDDNYDPNNDEELDYMYFKEHQDDYSVRRGGGSAGAGIGTALVFLAFIVVTAISPFFALFLLALYLSIKPML